MKKIARILAFSCFLCGCQATQHAAGLKSDELANAAGSAAASNETKTSGMTASEDGDLVPLNLQCEGIEVPPAGTFISSETMPWGSLKAKSLKWLSAENFMMYAEYPQFSLNYPGIDKINQSLLNTANEAFADDKFESILRIICDRIGTRDGLGFYNYQKANVTELDDKLVSVSICYEWFMGGVVDYGCKGYVYDLNSGNKLTIADYYQKDMNEMKEIIRAKLKEKIENEESVMWDLFDQHENFEFYIENGKVWVTFAKHEIADGARGGIDVELPLTL